MADTSLVVLGVDPGSQRTGWGIIAEQSGVLRLVDCGIIRTTSGGEKEFSRRLAVIYRQLADVVGRYRPQEAAIEQVFSECRAISIDYGIMEKADNVYVRCGDFGWSDVGTWGSVYQLSRKDAYANAKSNDGCYTYDTRNSIISIPAGKIAVIKGLKDYIVVDTDDVLMICPRSDEQSIKKYIDDVKFDKGDKYI